MKKKIYIAGKVSGEPIAECTMKFGQMQKEIEALGHVAVNPLQIVNSWKTPWQTAMRQCIAVLMDCDGILFLPCWADSAGAHLEMQICIKLEIPMFMHKGKKLSEEHFQHFAENRAKHSPRPASGLNPQTSPL